VGVKKTVPIAHERQGEKGGSLASRHKINERSDKKRGKGESKGLAEKGRAVLTREWQV